MLIVRRLYDAPAAALWPGLAGLLPFIALAVALTLVEAPLRALLERALIGYGALILAFIGAIHWGLALMATHAARAPHLRGAASAGMARFCFLWSVIPALWGWLALWAGFVPALALLGLGFIAQLAVDYRVSSALALPAWYLALRSVLTSVVLLCLLLASLASAMRA